ncbi:hypothetical protein AYX13_02685 [Cryptococcus neoformans]|nr:hypothetical protein AYX13_02685 [Cryptococcus neoformans var. grubii]
MYCTLATLSLLALAEAAGPHNRRLDDRRRHYARMALSGEYKTPPMPHNLHVEVPTKRDGCTHGDWNCVGLQLQRCNWGDWIVLQNCTGENIICSTQQDAVGCVWTWSVDDSTTSQGAQDIPLTTTSLVFDASSAVSASYASATASHGLDDYEPAGTASSYYAAATTSTTASDMDNEACDDEDDDEVCEDEDEDEDASSSAFNAATITSSATLPTSNAQETETSQIGDGLWAGHKSESGSSSNVWEGTAASSGNVWEGTASSDHKSRTKQWGSWKTTFASAESATTNPWDNTASATKQYWGDASATGSASQGKDHTSVQTGANTSVSYPAATASFTNTNTTTTTAGSSSNSASTTTGGWSAPHHVIYADRWLSAMPDVSELDSFNRFILAFWESSGGAVDDVQAWSSWDEDYRRQIIEAYHDAGIAIMIAAFGSTDQPTTGGADAKEVAQRLASFVMEYHLDGVDIDYEDMSAMNSARAVSWIVELQVELRNLLPSPYIISHAPVAPWFTSANDYSDGSYVAIHQQVGDTIDFYSVQFYNQGADQYVSCETLLTDSGSEWPSTSVFEINAYAGVPLDKIVIGKPLEPSSASNGYMSASDLHQCVSEAKEKGWNAGVMFWEWSEVSASSSRIRALLSSIEDKMTDGVGYSFVCRRRLL